METNKFYNPVEIAKLVNTEKDVILIYLKSGVNVRFVNTIYETAYLEDSLYYHKYTTFHNLCKVLVEILQDKYEEELDIESCDNDNIIINFNHHHSINIDNVPKDVADIGDDYP